MKRAGPRALAAALGAIREETAPRTLLATVQMAWPRVAGGTVAAEASPVAERAGVVTISCRSAVWAQELDLLGQELLKRLNAELDQPVLALRFTADAARHEAP